MTKRVFTAMTLVAVLAGGAALAVAQPPQGGTGVERQGPGAGRRLRGFGGAGLGDLGLRGIELTDAQRQQVRSIMESHRAEFEAVRTKSREAHRAFAEATRSETINEAAIRAQSAAVANAMAEEAILRAKVRAEVLGILTPEQQQHVKERQSRRQPRG